MTKIIFNCWQNSVSGLSLSLRLALCLVFLQSFSVQADSVQADPVQSGSVQADSVQTDTGSVQSCKQYDHLTFGILPFLSNEQLVTQFSPLAQYLTKKLEVQVRIETAPDFSEFAKRTLQGSYYDILFTAPHFYPRAHDEANYQLVASVDSPGMWAVIVAPKKSRIFSVQDLRGKRLATAHPKALSTLLVKKHLRNAGIDPVTDLTLVSTPSHDASLLSSYHGVTDASSLMQPPYTAASEQVRQNMRIIARTESSPHIPLSVNPRLNQNCATEIGELLLNMSASKEGRDALSHNRFSGFRKAHAEEYERIRDMLQSPE
ncbi:MAG: phosphate/phosphite/phosphonate ABC transporter substrate-binding protein [Gammaproteobacteria bacterium]